MQKYCITSLFKDKIIKIEETEEYTIYYLSTTNQLLKVFKLDYLFILTMRGINIEKQLYTSNSFILNQEIIEPTGMVYDTANNFIGYTIKSNSDITLNKTQKQERNFYAKVLFK